MPLTFVPLYLTYRSYKLYMGRIEDERQQVRQTANLHLATIEALARAIDAKDQSGYTRVTRVQLYAARLAQAIGLLKRAVPYDEVVATEFSHLWNSQVHDIPERAR